MGADVIRAANFLSADGVLLVVLKDPDSGCNRMLEHFGAPPFDLFSGLTSVLRRHKEFDFAFSHSPHDLRTTSFEDTLQVARFMMADRAEEAFSWRPTECSSRLTSGGIFGTRRKTPAAGGSATCTA